jgi:sorbitol/mannitol transport system permease protein
MAASLDGTVNRVSAAPASAKTPWSRQRLSMFLLVAPAVGVLLVWMIVPLALTIYFSLHRYNVLYPERFGFAGLRNFQLLLNDSLFWGSLTKTLILVGASLFFTVVLGVILALVMERDFPGRSIARLLALAPFFVMPVVAALVWKNMLMHPVYGLLSWASSSLGLPVVDWLQNWPMTSIIIIVTWQWTPFAMLVFLTALQSMPEEQKEAAWLDGANPFQMFFSIILPHLSRSITAVVMIESIFFLSIFAEVFTTTGGGPGQASTTLTYIIYARAFLEWNVGAASAGGLFAVVLANIVAIFLIRLVARNMQNPEKFG